MGDVQTVSVQWQVTSYRVQLGRQVGENQYAIIRVLGVEEQNLSIAFVYPDKPLPDNIYNEQTQSGSLYVPAEHFSWYIDLLRNEKPLYVSLFPEGPINNRLTCRWEPIGEAE
jgi:hypothetical protein